MYNAQETEKKILEFWKEKKIFEKLRGKNKGNKSFSFIDGPITANNPMGVHHAWGRTYKDLYQRFKAMQGFDQRWQNGFDCQGLWIEREEEKDLGLSIKGDIEKFGILNFVKACKKRAERFSKIQTEQSIKLGQWMEWENSYYTSSDMNNLYNWFLIKKYFENGWLYKGKDVVPWCWRCGTASSKHDIVTEGYKEVVHKALFMKFPVKDKKDEYFLIFTTTPWTVPANVVIAVNGKIDYVKVEQDKKRYWIAESRLNELKGNYKIIEKRKGKDLEGIKYEMPYKDFEEHKESAHEVVLWNLASEEEGTGIVHVAPGCGAEDYDIGAKLKLNVISPLDDDGIYGKDYGEFSGKKYSEVNKIVIEDLEKKELIYKVEDYKHRYPHCWRCSEELVFRMVDEWYVRCSKIREKLIKENKKIKWFPEYGKIRQEEWFMNMGDWLISRKRYWGLPLPIWECSCGNTEVIGSLKELREKAVDKKKVDKLPEIHRPWIDNIKIKCKKCGKEVERIKDVGDAWLDAGIVPFSTLYYLDNKKYWQEWFPADFICENMPGQYRGWFNALLWASVTIVGKTPFKTILGYETLKDEKGEEMHKSKGNVIWFDEAIEKIGADAMRLIYCLQNPKQELWFGFDMAKESRNDINILYNLGKLIENCERKNMNEIEDEWILSKLNSLIKKIIEELEKLHPHLATRALRDFWLNDLSRGYVQLVRDRIAENDEEVKYVLKEVYLKLIKLCAPVCPFITEKIWQELRKKKIAKEESVHLCSWPKVEEKRIDKKLEDNFSVMLRIVEVGMAERNKAKIGLRWPLSNAVVEADRQIEKELGEIIKKQLNIKDLKVKKGKKIKVKLDIRVTAELEAEGFAREICRNIQDERKKAGLIKENKIFLTIETEKEMQERLKKHEEMIKRRTNAIKFEFCSVKYKNMKDFLIKEKKFAISFEKK